MVPRVLVSACDIVHITPVHSLQYQSLYLWCVLTVALQAFFSVFGHGQEPGCKSKMILEMFDCIDNGMFAMSTQVSS